MASEGIRFTRQDGRWILWQWQCPSVAMAPQPVKDCGRACPNGLTQLFHGQFD